MSTNPAEPNIPLDGHGIFVPLLTSVWKIDLQSAREQARATTAMTTALDLLRANIAAKRDQLSPRLRESAELSQN
jgi:hypothetical protein